MKNYVMKIAAAVTLTACLVSSCVPINADAAEVTRLTLRDLGVPYRTQDEITSFIVNHPWIITNPDIHQTAPVFTAPYSQGKLKDDVENRFMNQINMFRYIVGENLVSHNSEYEDYAQCGSLVNDVNGSLSHTPEQPDGMSEEMYQKGYRGAGPILCGGGYDPAKIWVSDAANVYGKDNIGHRGWVLAPGVSAFGIGKAREVVAGYTRIDSAITDSNKVSYAWPAENVPSTFFETPCTWSVRLGSLSNLSSYGDVCVTLTGIAGKSNGKTWHFSDSTSDGYFSVGPGTIKFRPKEADMFGAPFNANPGDSYKIEVKLGNTYAISYSVNFFDPCKGSHNYVKDYCDLLTDAEEEDITYTCTVCGAHDYRHEPANPCSHSWSEWLPTSIGMQNYKTRTCSKCGEKEQVEITPEEAYELIYSVTGTKKQKMTVKTKNVTVKHSKLKRKNQSVKGSKVFIIKSANGTVSFKKISGNKKITISRGGKITLKKGLKKGTYKLKVKVTAAGNKIYKKKSKTVTVKIRVK